MRRVAAALACCALLLGGACGGDDDSGGDGGSSPSGPPPKGDASVTLQATTFDPAEVSITTGQTVVWKWLGGVQHNVNGGDEFKSELKTKGYFTHTFGAAGTFEYRCDVHPTTMKGTITVT